MSTTKIEIPFPKIDFAPPVYYCKRATKEFTLDGDLNKDFWADAPFTDLFEDIEGPSMPTPRYETRAKMLWDDKNLYVGAILYGDEIWAHQTDHDCVIFYDNDFEIFIDPDSDTQEYVEYEMNALGTYWDLLLTKAYRDGGSPINGLEVKGIKNSAKICGKLNEPGSVNKYWSVEVVIPFETLAECSVTRKAPSTGDFYRLNFSRVQWKVNKDEGKYEKIVSEETGKPLPEDNWVWSPTGVINIHYPELWGFLFFCDGDEKPSIPETELVKWELRKIYYAERAIFDETGSFSADKIQIKDTFDKYSAGKEIGDIALADYEIFVTPSTFEARAKTSDGKYLVKIMGDGKATATVIN